MASVIKLKNGSGVPLVGDLVQGEPALDLVNKRLYTEDSGGAIIEIGTNPSTINIDAGTIDGTPIGATTPATVAATTLSTTGAATFGGAVTVTDDLGLVVKSDAGNQGLLTLGGATFYGTVRHDAAATGANIYDVAAASGGGHIFRVGTVDKMTLDASGNLLAGGDNTQTLGGASNRWSVVYAGTGTINTSDAREKTAVSALTPDEVEASKQLGKEIGTYKWLSVVAEKGDAARTHIGMTVQRAIEIMTDNNLDPMAYGFICYDAWGDEFVDHPAIEAQEATEDAPAVEAVAAWTEQTKAAGDRYGFRYDELLAFLAAGFNARLDAAGL